jgi:hypothetical protein
VYEGISYKPFISLFNMTGVAQTYPQLAGIGEIACCLIECHHIEADRRFSVNYASAIVFEVREPASGNDALIRMLFKNGTEDAFNTYNMFGESGDIPLSEFKAKLLVCYFLRSLHMSNASHSSLRSPLRSTTPHNGVSLATTT